MTQTNKEKKELEVVYEVDNQVIKLTPSIVQSYIVGNNAEITMPEFKFFTELCKVQKLNPFMKEAYLIKYGKEPAQLVVSKDVILKRAIKHPQYDGKESGVIVRNKNGEIVEKAGCFVDTENEELLGGWCKVYRKDKSHPEYMSVSLQEVGQKKADGSLNYNWLKKTATMLEKVAKVRALRESFVDELAGMYDADEFVQEKPVEQANEIEDVIDVKAETKEVDINEL